MSEKETTVFKPNEKELRLFEQEKMELYKGTYVVCIVYGLSAFILLVIILFTDWGKVFIYDKFAPAVITYILGSLIIIIYLLNEIFTIKPRKIGADIDSDNNIKCPDFWRLQKVPNGVKADPSKGVVAVDGIKDYIINNNAFDINNKIIPQITREANANIQYRCIADDKVFGASPEYYKMKKELSRDPSSLLTGFERRADAQTYTTNETSRINNTLSPNYIVKIPDKSSPNYQDLKRYAKFTGGYSSNNPEIFDNASLSLKIASADYLSSSTTKAAELLATSTAAKSVYSKYEDNAPLICNVVYPQVLGLLDSFTKEKNEVSCEYAKQCGISWSSLKCN